MIYIKFGQKNPSRNTFSELESISDVTGGGGGAGAECPPETSDRETSGDLRGKKRPGKKVKGVKIEKKRRKVVNCKRAGGKLKMEGGKVKWGEDFFSFFLSFFFSLLKTTKICFGSPKIEIFYRGKHFTPEKKSGKMTLFPQKNFPVTPLGSIYKDVSLTTNKSA